MHLFLGPAYRSLVLQASLQVNRSQKGPGLFLLQFLIVGPKYDIGPSEVTYLEAIQVFTKSDVSVMTEII